ncbi:pre-mRNA-splicing factor isoform X2 [Tasmannia lanceolata]|uniref:pre-mRNA-splicing factor isoform X2 n=1 Tax=Tasmannia lanceolata TaxID=3420 RepID=UPI004062F267
MDSSLKSQSPDNSDVKPSFRKPSNDATTRKYRRRTPVSGSASSSSGGSPNRDRSHSPIISKEDLTKMTDDGRRKKDNGRDRDRDSSHNRSGRDDDLHRRSERHFHGSSNDHRRHDDYQRHHRHADEDERSYQRSSKSEREPRGITRSNHTRQESDYDRSRETWKKLDTYSRDRSDDRGRRSKDKDRETAVIEHRRQSDKDLSYEKAVSGSKQINSNVDEMMGEREKHRDRGGRGDKRDHRRGMEEYKNDHEEFRGHAKDSSIGRDSGVRHVKEIHKSSYKELDGQKPDVSQRRKLDDREDGRHKERYNREPEGYSQNDNRSSSTYRDGDARKERYQDKTIHVNEGKEYLAKKPRLDEATEDGKAFAKPSTFTADEKSSSSSKQVQVTTTKVTGELPGSSPNEAEAAHDLNAAKVAAMKAAELVNRNIVGGGFMSTDQKKKLLWGNKKNAAVEESGNRWDVPLFTDPERQEKFNKLMGVKGDLKMEHKSGNDGNSLLQAEKQKELQLDLEKQYTAGLRRRDGRTVGLGL